jgi:hypothetical protein
MNYESNDEWIFAPIKGNAWAVDVSPVVALISVVSEWL